MVTFTQSVTYVRNLCDNHNHDVTALTNKYKVSLRPGQEAALVKGPSSSVWNLVYSDNVARRDLKVNSIDSNTHVAISDFSHLNLMTNDPILTSLRSSKEVGDSKSFKQIERMAAIIATVIDRTRAPYSVPFESYDHERLATKTNPNL